MNSSLLELAVKCDRSLPGATTKCDIYGRREWDFSSVVEDFPRLRMDAWNTAGWVARLHGL